MDFQDLNLFIKLTETQNFAKTATQNHMSPSTLSRQIQRLEKSFLSAITAKLRWPRTARNFYNLLKLNGKIGDNFVNSSTTRTN